MIKLSDVRVDLVFAEKGQSLDKIKKELQEISKTANQGVKFGLFDKNIANKDRKNYEDWWKETLRLEDYFASQELKRYEANLKEKTRLNDYFTSQELKRYEANSKVDDLKLNNLIKLEAQYKELSKEAIKYSSIGMKKSQNIIENKLSNLSLSQIDVDVYKNEIANAKMVSELKTKNAIDEMTLQKISAKEASDYNRKLMEEDSRLLAKSHTEALKIDKDRTKAIEIENAKRLKLQQQQNKDIIDSHNKLSSTITTGLGMGAWFTAGQVSSLLPLEKQVYDLGVVANKSRGELDDLRNILIDISKEIPFSATEIGRAINDVARTGKSVEESILIVKEAGKLALASGEDLNSTVNVINKALTAFKIDGKDLGNILDKLHSIVSETPLSLDSLSDALKNASGAKTMVPIIVILCKKCV